jgi:hypothetical protein
VKTSEKNETLEKPVRARLLETDACTCIYGKAAFEITIYRCKHGSEKNILKNVGFLVYFLICFGLVFIQGRLHFGSEK